MEIKILDKETGKNLIIQNQIYALFKQLSPNKRPLNFDEILHQNNQIVLIACFIADKVVGIASMANYSVISGKKGWIEDVVVSENYRGMGIGRKLIEKLLAIADEEYLTEVLLFTEDHRNAAIHLYESLNFKRKESDIFVLKKITMIRKATHKDIKKLAEIWLKTSIIAHDFIPEKYWTDNKSLMEEQYLPNSEVYLAEKEGYILGFVALIENHIASIFVDKEQQGKGTGSLLLNYAKELRTELTLNVYQKNQKSVNFYKAKGFKVVAETIDKPTGEKEFKMHWKNTER